MPRPPALVITSIASVLLVSTLAGAGPRKNAAPVVKAGADQTITLPSGSTLAATVTDDGLPYGRLTQTWSRVAGPGTVQFGSPTSKTTSATFSVAGTYTVRLTASDGALTGSDDVIVVVKAAVVVAPAATNQYPVVSAGASQSIMLRSLASLSGTATDDGLPSNTLTTAWSMFSGPGTVTFTNASSTATTASFSAAGSYVLRLTASDSLLTSTADTTVTVQANQPPVVSAGPAMTITLPGTATLSGTVSDDGYPVGSTVAVTWSLVRGPGSVAFSTPGALSTVATFSAAGSYVVRLSATDTATTSYADATITVNATSNSGPAQTPIPSTLFGMHLIDKNAWPTTPIGALGKGTFVNWPYVEQVRGVRNWTNVDAWVNQAEARGVPIFHAFEMAPAWAVSAADQYTCEVSSGYNRCFGMPDLTALDSFVTEFVTRYKGRIAMYELYNEPDILQVGRTLTPAELVVVAQHEYNIIRAIDPAALIAAPSGGYSYMDQFWTAGGVKTVDVLAYHIYPDPTRYTTSNYAAAERIQYWPDALIGVYAKHGMTQPMWDTEGSWNMATGVMANEADQVAFVARSFLLHWSKGFQRAYWYAWDQPNLGTFWDQATGEHAAAKAFRQVQDWMIGATMPAACAMSGASVMFNGEEPAQYACTLTRAGGYQALAIWNTNGATPFTPPSIYKQYRDLDGNVVPITGSITVGYKPLLLETGPRP